MFSAREHINNISELEHGATRLDAISNAIREADEASAHEWRFYFRYEAIRESIFHDDAFKALLMFPELLKIYDDHPELEDEYADDLLTAFKWIIENATEFYQVSREDIERYFEAYKRRCEEYGVSLRVYHMKRCRYLLNVDEDAARAEYEAFHRCKRDGYSDCEACEIHFDMTVALEFGEEEKALEIAQPLLSGEKRCSEVPHFTYAHLAEFYLYQGNLEEAAYYGELCARLTGGDPEFLSATGTLLAVYSAVDPNSGWKLFKQCLPMYQNCKNAQMRMKFADGAYRLMRVLYEVNMQNDGTTMSQAPVLRCLPLTWTDKGVSMADIRDFFYNEARDAAKKLDDRNHATYFTEKLSREIIPVDLENLPEDAPKKPAHGIVRRENCPLVVTLPMEVHVSLETMLERLEAAVPEETEILSSLIDEEGLFLSCKRDDRIHDYMITIIQSEDAPPGEPVADLDDGTFAKMQENPEHYIMNVTLGDNAQIDYHYAMRLLSVALPEMLGVQDIRNQHAYSADWVKFCGAHDAAVMPNDLFGLYLSGDQELDEVWITTIGMEVMGLRELEVIGADTKNFGKYADILDHAAAQITDRGMLPDEYEKFGTIYIDGEPYAFGWRLLANSEGLTPLAASIPHDGTRGELLLETDDGFVRLTESELLANAEEIDYSRSNRDFHRRIALSKQTYPYFEKAVTEKPFDMAAVRMEFRLSDEMREKYDYGIELLWCEVTEVKDGVIYAEVKETEETLPDVHEGDIVTIEGDRVASWVIRLKGQEHSIGYQEAYYLTKKEAAQA